ncbi:hypothetical protein TNCV_2213741 [Trichonephila clavipes]|nr:hypothetical protein TNCV_2213741 [Trichonephila clavipes]
MTPEMLPPSPNVHAPPTGGRLSFNRSDCIVPTQWVFSGTSSLNSWVVQLAVPNNPRYARLETNTGIGEAKEGE